jgi:hypothetical protein
MDCPQKMDVVDWQGSPQPIAPKAEARRPLFPPTIIGIFGTVLLHAMLIQSVSFATRGPKPKAQEAPESTSALSNCLCSHSPDDK